jgi:hypothetical protein
MKFYENSGANLPYSRTFYHNCRIEFSFETACFPGFLNLLQLPFNKRKLKLNIVFYIFNFIKMGSNIRVVATNEQGFGKLLSGVNIKLGLRPEQSKLQQ